MLVAIASVLDAEVREGDPLIYHDRKDRGRKLKLLRGSG